MIETNHYEPKSQSGCMAASKEHWELSVVAVAAISAAILGAGFSATAAMSLVGALCLGAVVTPLSGLGGFAIAVVLIMILEEMGPEQDRRIVPIVTLALIVVGAVGGFFAFGGVVAAVTGALTLTGAGAAVSWGMFVVAKTQC